MSALRERFATQSKPIEVKKRDTSYPREVRLVRSSDFRKVYEKGFRIAGPYFAAFCLRTAGQRGPRIGMAVPRAAGKAVIRNRLKRRLREAVRLSLWQLGPEWMVVITPRRTVLTAPFEDVRRAVEKLFLRCGQ